MEISMANQRVYLKHNPTGKTRFLFKRFGDQYKTIDGLQERLDKFLDEINEYPYPLDDFSIELEMPKGF